MDNKRFAFVRCVPLVLPTGQVYEGADHRPFAPNPGTVRFEHGAVVDEFYDLRANTRCVSPLTPADNSCVLESQVLAYKQAACANGTQPARILLLTDEDK